MFPPLSPFHSLTPLAKRPSDLNQNGTQEKMPLSGTVFRTLSHGVIQSEASIQWFLKLTLETRRSTPCEITWKTVQENSIFSCVPF